MDDSVPCIGRRVDDPTDESTVASRHVTLNPTLKRYHATAPVGRMTYGLTLNNLSNISTNQADLST